MKSLHFIIITFFSCFFSVIAQVQLPMPNCWKHHNIVVSPAPCLTSIPLTTDMTLDALLGYIVIDSITKSFEYTKLSSRVSEFVWGDTLKKIAKYLYILKDYDPIRFLSFCNLRYKGPGGERIATNKYKLIDDLLSQVLNQSPFKVDEPLLRSDYILQIFVEDTLRVVDTVTSKKEYLVVKARVEHRIKGRRVPYLMTENFEKYGAEPTLSQSSFGNTCDSGTVFEFTCPLYYQRTIDSLGRKIHVKSSLTDSDNKPMLKKGARYIVFLQIGLACSECPAGLYYGIGLLRSPSNPSYNYKIFKIDENNIIQNPHDEIGAQENLSRDQFVDFLKQRISQIIAF